MILFGFGCFFPWSQSNTSNLLWLEAWCFCWCVGRSQGICFPLLSLASKKYCFALLKLCMCFLYSSVVKRVFSFPFLHTSTIIISEILWKMLQQLKCIVLSHILLQMLLFDMLWKTGTIFYTRKSKLKLLLSSDSFLWREKYIYDTLYFFHFFWTAGYLWSSHILETHLLEDCNLDRASKAP